MNPCLFSFIGGRLGDWSVTSFKAIIGEPLATVDRLMIMSGVPQDLLDDADWVLRAIAGSMHCETLRAGPTCRKSLETHRMLDRASEALLPTMN